MGWPRELARDDDALGGGVGLLRGNEYFASDAIPRRLLDATVETARELIKANRTDDPDGEGLSRLTLTGTLSMAYDKKDRAPIIPHVALAMLSKLGAYAKRNPEVVRLMRT